MTVREAILFLSQLPDKEISMMIDCPYCGKGNQLAKMGEAVILYGKVEPNDQ